MLFFGSDKQQAFEVQHLSCFKSCMFLGSIKQQYVKKSRAGFQGRQIIRLGFAKELCILEEEKGSSLLHIVRVLPVIELVWLKGGKMTVWFS